MSSGTRHPDPEPPAARLTRAAVLAEALRLLDDDGYDALTMRRLADRLGVVPMAIYRHVSNKEDLVDALLDLAVAQVPLPDPGLDWHEGLRALAVAVRDTMLAHPAIVVPLVTRPSLGVHALAIGEYGLAVMREAGFSDEEALRGPNAVLTYTIGFVALEVPRLGQGDALDVPFDLLDDAEFPHTKATRPPARQFVSDQQFAYGLECLLAGIAGDQPPADHPRSGSQAT